MDASEALRMLERGTVLWCGCLVQGPSRRLYEAVAVGTVTAEQLLACWKHGVAPRDRQVATPKP